MAEQTEKESLGPDDIPQLLEQRLEGCVCFLKVNSTYFYVSVTGSQAFCYL